MIKIFNKIRQQLLSENQFGRYLLYAIGEIVLVVIGILIALSINNWNTYRKDRIKEKELLEGIVINLELNKKLILERIDFMDRLNENAGRLLKLQDKQISHTDSIDMRLYAAIALPAVFTLPDQGFESLKHEGVDVILNDHIRNETIKLFNVTYNLTNIRFSEVKNRHSHQYQYIDKNFRTVKSEVSMGGLLQPYNVDQTFNDNYFFSIINSYIHSREQLKYFLEMDLAKTEDLLIRLEQSGF